MQIEGLKVEILILAQTFLKTVVLKTKMFTSGKTFDQPWRILLNMIVLAVTFDRSLVCVKKNRESQRAFILKTFFEGQNADLSEACVKLTVKADGERCELEQEYLSKEI